MIFLLVPIHSRFARLSTAVSGHCSLIQTYFFHFRKEEKKKLKKIAETKTMTGGRGVSGPMQKSSQRISGCQARHGGVNFALSLQLLFGIAN